MSEPWIVYGQTTATTAPIDNPAPNSNGILGEVTSLPYTVPANKKLVLTAWGIEAHGNVAGCMVLFPWIGTGITNAKCLHSCLADNAFNETLGAEYHIPAGKILNFRMLCTETPGNVVGWYASGKLEDVT